MAAGTAITGLPPAGGTAEPALPGFGADFVRAPRERAGDKKAAGPARTRRPT